MIINKDMNNTLLFHLLDKILYNLITVFVV